MAQCVNDKRWNVYYDVYAGRPARETLLKALALLGPGAGRQALDLGCGAGNDTFEMLGQGWQVLALDKQEEAIRRVLANCPAGNQPQLSTQVVGFEEMAGLPPAELINASLSLPFCQPQFFGQVWQQVVDRLRPGGYFAGHLLGKKDSWANLPDLTTLHPTELDQLLRPFEIVHYLEEEKDEPTVTGKMKHWHIYSLVIRKPVVGGE